MILSTLFVTLYYIFILCYKYAGQQLKSAKILFPKTIKIFFIHFDLFVFYTFYSKYYKKSTANSKFNSSFKFIKSSFQSFNVGVKIADGIPFEYIFSVTL